MSIVSVARLDAVVLRVRDLDRSISWYSNTLGLTPAHRDDATGIAILRLEGAPLTLWRIPAEVVSLGADSNSPEAAGADSGLNNRVSDVGTQSALEHVSAAHVSAFPIFAVHDAEAAHAALLNAGVQVSPLREDLSVRWCEFTDPDGNRLEVCESVV